MPVSHALTRTQVDVLYVIWRIEAIDCIAHADITLERIKQALGNLRISTIRKVLSELENTNFLIFSDHHLPNEEGGKRRRGRPKRVVRINKDAIIHRIDTAKIVMELDHFERDEPFRVNLEKFKQHIVDSYRISMSTVEDRINACLSLKYIDEEGDGFVFPSERVNRERALIRKIAEHFNSQDKEVILRGNEFSRQEIH